MTRTSPSSTFALSPMQQGMLFHHLKEPHSGVDIEQIVVHLPEKIDAARMERAWQWLVQRHEVLRTRFIWEGPEPQQQVAAEVAVPFSVRSEREGSASERNERLKKYLEADRVRGFAMNQAPMLRLALFEWGEESFSLVWSFHHALLDGRSYPVLLREVFEAYGELMATGTISERPEPFSYRRYIDWLQKESFEESTKFWKRQLKGFTAATPLVVDRPTAAEGYQQGEAWDQVNAAVTATLRNLAERRELTLNTVVMGAWAILLHKYSREEDLLFAATRAGRKSSVAHADETIGLFINTVPVRAQVRDEDAVVAVCRAIRELWLEMRPYEHTPLSRIKAVSEVPASQPLFETLFVFESYRLDTVMHALGGAWSKRRVELHELTNFPVTLAAYDGEELAFKIEFDRRRLNEATVRRMLGHLRQLLEEIAKKPDASVGELSMLTELERADLLEDHCSAAPKIEGSDLPLDGGATLHELFERQVARRPEAVALTCDGMSLSYAQANARANRVARRLVEFGVKPETLVGLCLDRTNEIVVAILAILKSGGAYLPIDLAYPPERLAFMLEDAQVPVLLTQRELTSRLPATAARVLCIEDVLECAATDPAEEENLGTTSGPDNLAYVIYTSGTTGKPKGSLLTHRNVARLFPATEGWYGFNERDSWTLFHSCAFDFSVWEIWGALLYGGRVVVVPFLVSRSPEAFYELLTREKVTVLNQTPSAFRQLMQAEEAVGQKELALRYVIFGGEALEMQSLRPWFERHGDVRPQLVNMYGITETTVHVTYRALSKDDLNSGSVIGVPIPDLQIYILDASGQMTPVGVPGEMHVGGAGLARGYLRRPELTEQRFIADRISGRKDARLYKTGDLARFLPGRDIEYLGRIDHQVKIRGFRIELGEIESVLLQHAAVRSAVVLAREDEPGVKRLAAYVVTAPPAPDVSELREHLKKKLPDYMVPAAFVFLEKLPLTASGKVDMRALPVPESQRPELTKGYAAPKTETEKKLARIWEKALRVERVGVEDNFFELGGDSILSIQIISAARREGLKLTPKLLFANQTVAELAAAAGISGEERPVGHGPVSGEAPLTPIERWFFEQNLAEPQHYNQAFLFEVGEKLEQAALENALRAVEQQHDALRLRFERDGKGWQQHYAARGSEVVLEWHDFSRLDELGQRKEMEGLSARQQSLLNLQRGPLWRVAYFDLGAGRPGRLLIVVHHLAVDGVSWRPLLEDLESAYRQASAGKTVELPAKTAAYKSWAEHLQEFAKTEGLRKELPFWKALIEPQEGQDGWKTLEGEKSSQVENLEGSAKKVRVKLDCAETQALLQSVPTVYNTQVNDVLLTALAQAWKRVTGSNTLFTDLEGHGREHLFEDVDISRTVGWFTSIFPVRLELTGSAEGWRPGEALKQVKEQLRRIPRRGVGYGILRYLAGGEELVSRPEPEMVFNYLGQFDQAVAGSGLWRFAQEDCGPWHSPKQKRRYDLELNSVVIGGRLELECTYAAQDEKKMQQLADEFVEALREIITHCQSAEAGGRTPSDFPLAKIGQAELDRLLAEQQDVEEITALSPMQTLFFSANQGAIEAVPDQWSSTLNGVLDERAFERAWKETVQRHAILRTTIASSGLREPVQVVHRSVRVPWIAEDWQATAKEEQEKRWAKTLAEDRAKPLFLNEAPVMRFRLIRLTETSWKFLWSVPAMFLDGWSWPVVFRDASRLYEAYVRHETPRLEKARPYRDYLEWLGQQPSEEGAKFWKQQLAGWRRPTALVSDPADRGSEGERFPQVTVELSKEDTAALQSAARGLQVTLSSLVQGSWALLLARQSGDCEVVFGSAFSGRPADLAGVEGIVGPFTNNLPVRVAVKQEESVGEFFKAVHARLSELNGFQHTPLMEIQRGSEVPWRYRLFDSLIVFQNYAVDEQARRFGDKVEIADFSGPIHTNYPVLLLAEPGTQLRLTLIYERRAVARSSVERWSRDLQSILERAPRFFEKRVRELLGLLSPQPERRGEREQTQTAHLHNFVAAQTEMEKNIASVWQKMFGLEQVGVETNFFDLGGHSMLLVQMHRLLREELHSEFAIVALFEHPTIRELARYLGQPVEPATVKNEHLKERAERQRRALAKMRAPVKR